MQEGTHCFPQFLIAFRISTGPRRLLLVEIKDCLKMFPHVRMGCLIDVTALFHNLHGFVMLKRIPRWLCKLLETRSCPLHPLAGFLHGLFYLPLQVALYHPWAMPALVPDLSWGQMNTVAEWEFNLNLLDCSRGPLRRLF